MSTMMQADRSAVVFDVGCTLIHPSNEVLLAMLDSMHPGLAPAGLDVAAAFRYACEANLRRLPSGSSDAKQGRAFFSALGINISVVEAESFWREVGGRGGAGRQLYNRLDEHALKALELLRSEGHLLVAASNSDGSLTEELTYFGLDVLFDLTFDSTDIGFEKPATGFFRTVLDAIAEHGAIGETWYIGDDPIRDVVGSLANGFDRAVLYDPYTLHGSLDAACRIEGLDRLPSLIAGAVL